MNVSESGSISGWNSSLEMYNENVMKVRSVIDWVVLRAELMMVKFHSNIMKIQGKKLKDAGVGPPWIKYCNYYKKLRERDPAGRVGRRCSVEGRGLLTREL